MANAIVGELVAVGVEDGEEVPGVHFGIACLCRQLMGWLPGEVVDEVPHLGVPIVVALDELERRGWTTGRKKGEGGDLVEEVEDGHGRDPLAGVDAAVDPDGGLPVDAPHRGGHLHHFPYGRAVSRRAGVGIGRPA